MSLYRQNIFRFHRSFFRLRLEEREREREREKEHEDTRAKAVIVVVMQMGDHTTTTTPTNVVNPGGHGEKQAEIYTHEAPWLIYACNWSVRCFFERERENKSRRKVVVVFCVAFVERERFLRRFGVRQKSNRTRKRDPASRMDKCVLLF